MKKCFASLCLLFLGVTGCSEADITGNDLKGTWVLSEASRWYLPAHRQKALPKIVIEENGTFSADQIPSDLLGWEDVRLISGSGVWKLRAGELGQRLELEFRVIKDSKEYKTPFGAQLILQAVVVMSNFTISEVIQTRGIESSMKRQINNQENSRSVGVGKQLKGSASTLV